MNVYIDFMKVMQHNANTADTVLLVEAVTVEEVVTVPLDILLEFSSNE